MIAMRNSLILIALVLVPVAAQPADLYATTTSYEVFGGTAQIQMAPPWSSTLDEYQIHSDAVVRDYNDRWVFIVNRLYGDNILVLDRNSGYGVVTQYSVAATGLNPRDIHVAPSAGPASAPGRAFIPLYESNLLLVCDALSGNNVVTIDLSTFADADGLCEMDRLVELPASPGHPSGRLALSLQNMDRSGSTWIPTDAAQLVLIDIATESLIDADPVAPGMQGIDLQLTNPFWRLSYGAVAGGWKILVNCTGQYGVQDGGIEMVDPWTMQSDGVLFSEAQLGGDLLDFALLGQTIGWAIRSDASFRTQLVRFDPSTGLVQQVVLSSSGFDLSDLEMSYDARLFVGDRAASNPGIRVYDPVSGALIAGPLDTGLPPFDFTLLDEIPVSVPPLRLDARLTARPNPFNPRVVIRLPLADAPGESMLEILDLRGRLVQRLAASRDDAGLRWVWDGRNRDGAAVASGSYFARAVGVDTPPARLTLVR
ncbi:hypothetical protein DRQ53_03470 [bacterium]|nr:MAG: hypothetical protein DRQ32_00675 [bacterium]RKZ17458.1 MAG: hypothetical protein DRQ53_03470 [bacterium]